MRDGKRTVIVQVSHIGVEPDLLRSAEGMAPAVSLTPTVPRRASASDVHTMSDTAEDVKAEASLLAHLAEVRRQGKTLVVGVDEMERLKGIPLKLIAYEEFLRNNAEHNVVFVQVAVRAKNFTPAVEADYEDVKEEVSEVMSRLSKEYPGAVIFEELNVISMHGRGQLWRHADVAVFTPIREGVNAWPFEAIFARRDGTPGVTILSEFASCSRVLNGALRCNPWNTNQVRLTLERAVKMDEGERRARQERDLEFILHNTASSWAERFFDEMRKACARNAELQEEGTMIQLGFGLSGFRRVGLGAAFRPLDTTEVLAAYRKARRRAIFLDWGGTLVHLEAGFASTLIDYYRSSLPAQVAHVIKELAEDPRNMLMVLSGQDRKYVERAFGGIGDASFCAEHGFLYKLGSLPGIKRVAHTEWQQLVEDFDLSWKEVTLAILEAYTMRTNGSNVQQKGSSLVWNYSEVDREFGSMQAKELHHHLSTVLESYPVNIAMGKGYLEVRPRDINKGVMVDHIVSTLYTNCGGVDFVLCIGDDSADEYMFSALHARFSANALPHGAFAPALFTTVVGQKPSAAQYFLNDPDEVIELCQSLRLHSTRSNRNRSMNDLQSRGGMQDFGVSPSTSRHPRSNPFPALPGGTSFERARSSGIGGLGASGSGWQR